MRRIVIGDIHGCARALRSLIEAIDPSDQDELVFLGDYIDRGPSSRDVVNQVIELQRRCQVVPLLGNHEIMLMGVALRGLDQEAWLRSGGKATVTSYGGSLSKIPEAHWEFFRSLQSFYETEESIFVHAGYDPGCEMAEMDESTLFWTHLLTVPPPHQSGKRVFVGHTPQPGGNILHAEHVVCVDTYCFGGGFLTALDVDSFEIIQTDLHGHIRRAPLAAIAEGLARMRDRLSRLWRRPSAVDTAAKSPDAAAHEKAEA